MLLFIKSKVREHQTGSEESSLVFYLFFSIFLGDGSILPQHDKAPVPYIASEIDDQITSTNPTALQYN